MANFGRVFPYRYRDFWECALVFVGSHLVDLFRLVRAFLLLYTSMVALYRRVYLLRFRVVQRRVLASAIRYPTRYLYHSVQSIVVPFCRANCLTSHVVVRFRPTRSLYDRLFSHGPVRLRVVSSVLVYFPSGQLSGVVGRRNGPRGFVYTCVARAIRSVLPCYMAIIQHVLKYYRAYVGLQGGFDYSPNFVDRPRVVQVEERRGLRGLCLGPLYASVLRVQYRGLRYLADLFFGDGTRLHARASYARGPRYVLYGALRQVSRATSSFSFGVLRSARGIRRS